MIRYLTTTNNSYFDSLDFANQYIQFMTTPNSHNDTYAATAHRMFFKNLKEGKKVEECPDNDSHNVDSIDALTFVVPVILFYSNQKEQERNQNVLKAIKSVRNTREVDRYAHLFSDLLFRVINSEQKEEQLAKNIQETADQVGMKHLERYINQPDPMTACYIDSSFPAFLFLTYKYRNSIEKAILANANAGGENVARGSLLGAIMGAHYGFKAFPEWTH